MDLRNFILINLIIEIQVMQSPCFFSSQALKILLRGNLIQKLIIDLLDVGRSSTMISSKATFDKWIPYRSPTI